MRIFIAWNFFHFIFNLLLFIQFESWLFHHFFISCFFFVEFFSDRSSPGLIHANLLSIFISLRKDIKKGIISQLQDLSGNAHLLWNSLFARSIKLNKCVRARLEYVANFFSENSTELNNSSFTNSHLLSRFCFISSLFVFPFKLGRLLLDEKKVNEDFGKHKKAILLRERRPLARDLQTFFSVLPTS